MADSRQSPASSDAWSSNLATSIQQLETQLAKLNQRLATLQKIAQGIESYGGWEKFKHNYSAKLRQYMAEM